MADFDDYFDLYEKGAYQEAYKVLLDIVKNNPWLSNNGDIYVKYADLELLANDDVYEAQKLLEKAHDLGCSEIAFYYSIQGYVLWRIGERDLGIQYLEKSIALDPRISCLQKLGSVLSYDNDKRAVEIWERILEKDPENCLAHTYLAIEAAKSGNREKALTMARQAENFAHTALDLFEMGRFYWNFGQLQVALNKYLEADKLGYEPKRPLFIALSRCYYSLDCYREAIEYANRALKINSNNDQAKEVLLAATGEKVTKTLLNALIEEHRGTCTAFILLAREAFRQKNISKTLELVKEAQRLKPSLMEMFYIAHTYYDLGDFRKALELFLECDKPEFGSKRALYLSIARCYYESREFESSIYYAKKVLIIDPSNIDAKEVINASKEGK